jgi:hypothetical protein
LFHLLEYLDRALSLRVHGFQRVDDRALDLISDRSLQHLGVLTSFSIAVSASFWCVWAVSMRSPSFTLPWSIDASNSFESADLSRPVITMGSWAFSCPLETLLPRMLQLTQPRVLRCLLLRTEDLPWSQGVLLPSIGELRALASLRLLEHTIADPFPLGSNRWQLRDKPPELLGKVSLTLSSQIICGRVPAAYDAVPGLFPRRASFRAPQRPSAASSA